MFEKLIELTLSKVDPKLANEFIGRCNKALETQERIAKAQEEVAVALRDLIELKKKRGKK